MADAYTVEGNLAFKTNALVMVADLIKQFDRLDAVIAGTQKSLAGLAAELRTLNSGGRGITGAAKSLEALAKARLSPELLTGLKAAETATAGLVTMQRDLAKLSSETAANFRAMGRAAGRVPAGGGGGGAGTPPGPARRGRRHDDGFTSHDLLNAGIGLQAAGSAGMGVLEKSFMAEAAVLQQLAALRMNTKVDDAAIAKARAAAEAATRAVPGSTLAENTHHMVDLFTVFGDLNEAMAGLPVMARGAYVFQNLPGAHKGDSSFAAAQAVELMQRFVDPVTHKVSEEAFNRELSAIARVTAATQGRFDGNTMLGFAKQARAAGMILNDQFLHEDLPAIGIALGGNRAGTGEAALFSQFITGRMTKNAAEQLKRAGILDKRATWKGGQVQDMQHMLHGFETFGQNPMQWVREYMFGPNGALARNHVDENDKQAVAKFLSDWSSRQTGLGFMSELVLGRPGIDKEGEKLRSTTDDPLSVIQQYDPMQKVRELQAAENQLFVTLGQASMGPAIEVLKELTVTLRTLAEFAAAHPTLAKDVMLGIGAGSVLSLAAGSVASAVFLGAPVAKGFTALARRMFGGAAAGGAAGEAAAGGAAATEVAAGTSLAARLIMGMGPAAILSGIAVAHQYMRPLTEEQARRHAPWLAAPQDGFDVEGRPVGGTGRLQLPPPPPPVIDMTVQVTVDNKIDGQTVASSVASTVAAKITKLLSGPAGGITGFDTRASHVGTMMPGP